MSIYAIDFDGTLTFNKGIEPAFGEPNLLLIHFLINQRKAGHKLILWTCRTNESKFGNYKALNDAVSYCEKFGLFFDAINENIPEILELYGNDSRKITADYYIDDRNCVLYGNEKMTTIRQSISSEYGFMYST